MDRVVLLAGRNSGRTLAFVKFLVGHPDLESLVSAKQLATVSSRQLERYKGILDHIEKETTNPRELEQINRIRMLIAEAEKGVEP